MNSFDGPKDKESRKKLNKLENIKNTFFLQIMFDYILKNKYFGMIKYNKNMQKKMNLNINDYKEFSKIELEIIPKKRVMKKFINVLKDYPEYDTLARDTIKEGIEYYHIYLNDNKEEFKRHYLIKNELDEVKKIKIIIDHQVLSLEKLFQDCQCIESICFKKFYRNDIKKMNNMFIRCLNLKEIKFSSFNTNHVTNMSCMFAHCTSLEELNLSNFNTINVTDMESMFGCCYSLKKLNVSNFNTSKVENMHSMFHSCRSLKELNLSNFNTNKVIKIDCMFYGCSSLKELDLSNFNTNKVDDMSAMFNRCSSLKKLDISNFNFDNVTKMEAMFFECPNELQAKIKEKYNIIRNEAFEDAKCLIF